MIGGSAVCGRRLSTVLTLSRTSWVATSGSFERSKVIVMDERPVLELERNSSMPVAVLTAPSITSVTSDSISAGAAPVLVVETVTVGMSIFGKRSTPSVKKENPPMTVNARMMTVAKTGRRTQISANFCITYLRLKPHEQMRLRLALPLLFVRLLLLLLLLRLRLLRHLHSCALVELLQIARRHHLVALHAGENLYPTVLFIANL